MYPPAKTSVPVSATPSRVKYGVICVTCLICVMWWSSLHYPVETKTVSNVVSPIHPDEPTVDAASQNGHDETSLWKR